MSLIDGGPEVLQVWPERTIRDARGNYVRQPVKTGPGIAVRGRMQPASSEETATDGQLVSTLWAFIGRVFPAGPWAAVTWDGRDWDVVGEPAVHRGASPRTSHVSVLLRARSPRVL